MLLIGTMHSIIEQPRRICGISNSPKSQSAVRCVIHHVPAAKPNRPIIIISRRSILLDRKPEIGAVTNIARPLTNRASPIIKES